MQEKQEDMPLMASDFQGTTQKVETSVNLSPIGKGENTPVQGEDIPKQGEDTPAQGEDTPGLGEDIPGQEGKDSIKQRFENLKKDWRVPAPDECHKGNRIMDGNGATVDWQSFGDFDQVSDYVGGIAESTMGRKQSENGVIYKIKLPKSDRDEIAKAWAPVLFNVSRSVLKSSPLMDVAFAAFKTKGIFEEIGLRAGRNPEAYVEVLGFADREEPGPEEFEAHKAKQEEKEKAEREAQEKPKKRGRGRPKGSKNKPKVAS